MQDFIEVDVEKLRELNDKYVEEMNKILPSGKKAMKTFTFDISLMDKKTTMTVTIAERLKYKREMQAEILERLAKENNYELPKYPTVISAMFLTTDTAEAEEYNEELFKDYIKNPKKYLYEEVRKVLDIKAKDLYELDKDQLQNAEFYEKNFTLVENASKLVDIIKNDPEITKELKDALPGMETLIKIAAYPKNLTMKYEADLLAFPKLSDKQAQILNAEYKNNPDLNPEIKKYIENRADSKNTYAPKQYFHELHRVIRSNNNESDRFASFDKYMTKLMAYSNERGHEGEIIDMDNVVFRKGGLVGFRIVDEPISRIGLECITNEVKEKYINLWQEKFIEFRGKGKEFDIDAIEFEHRGGFWERFRGTTSNEYKEMIRALREFNDPKSKNYLNYENLKEKAEGYIAHKESQGYGDTKEYTGTSKKRKDLADAILEMEDTHKEIMQKIKSEFTPSIKVPESEIEKEQVFESNDIVEVIVKKPEQINAQEEKPIEIEEIDDDSPNFKIDDFINNK